MGSDSCGEDGCDDFSLFCVAAIFGAGIYNVVTVGQQLL